jgi:hypothetical protein
LKSICYPYAHDPSHAVLTGNKIQYVWKCFQNGGTGVAPVQSGVTPDGVRGEALPIGNRKAELVAGGFGRDAQNHRPEAGATRNEFENTPTNLTRFSL